MSYYEEITFNLENDIILPYYGECIQKRKKSKSKTNNQNDYVDESIKEAIKHFKNTDLRRKDKTISPCTQSRYFYNMDIVKRVLEKLNNLNRVVTFRNIGDNQNPCYEMNFEEVLKHKKLELF